jgi:hypothetical protein
MVVYMVLWIKEDNASQGWQEGGVKKRGRMSVVDVNGVGV